MDAIVDTDFARCTRTGKSTNGGTQLTKSWPARRPFRDVQWRGGVLRRREGSVRGRGYVVSLLQDVTRRNNVLVSTDSSTARGIAMRWSVVKVRHLEVRSRRQDRGPNQPSGRVYQAP